jgi:hypothetical protein
LKGINTIKQDVVDFILGADLGYRHDPSQICSSLSEILGSVKGAGGDCFNKVGRSCSGLPGLMSLDLLNKLPDKDGQDLQSLENLLPFPFFPFPEVGLVR